MTTPGTITEAAASPVLGQQPDRDAGVVDVASVPGTAAEASAVEQDAAAPLPQVLRFRDGGGRVHYASPYSKFTRARVAAGDWSELGDDEPDAADPFDPTEHLVREVVSYLEEHAGDEDEVTRVKEAEAEGENRPTIRDWAPDPQS